MPDSPGPVVSNTGPLSALALLDLLFVLPQFYGEILVPPAVMAELARGRVSASGMNRPAGDSTESGPYSEIDFDEVDVDNNCPVRILIHATCQKHIDPDRQQSRRSRMLMSRFLAITTAIQQASDPCAPSKAQIS